MFTKLCIAAATSALVSAEDPSVTMFLADTGHAASMWQDEREFESGVRGVMQMQTADLEKIVEKYPHSLLLQTEIATQKVLYLFVCVRVCSLKDDLKKFVLRWRALLIPSTLPPMPLRMLNTAAMS